MLKRDRGVIDSSENSAAKRAIILSSIGEVVVWFDFMVYLSLAPVLAKVIFAPNDSSSLVMTLGIFGAAFLARPIGAILFGHLGDRFGRKRALVTSALLMALAKMVEGLLPTYSTAGHLAPAIFLVARIASGFSLGGEFTGTAVMLFESTQPGRRGLTTSLANIMGGVGVFLVSGLVGLLTINLSPAVMESWGWRVPFFAGSLIGLVALGIRARVPETPLFEKLQSRGKTVRTPLRESLRGQPRHPSHIRASWLQRALLLPCCRLRANLPRLICQNRTCDCYAYRDGRQHLQCRVYRYSRLVLGHRRTQAVAYYRKLRISHPYLSALYFAFERKHSFNDLWRRLVVR